MATPPYGAAPGDAQAGPPPPGRRISMLGAPQTGKTTFLGALRVALLRQEELGWSLRGDDQASAEALVKFVSDMTQQHIFPRPTGGRIETYNWSLEGELPAVLKWERWRFRRRPQYARIPLDLGDVGGEAADDAGEWGRASSRNLIDRLARSSGILLFFDPVREFERGDAFQHMYGVLTQLAAEMQHSGRLPHYVAVCIAKFDDVSVFEAARKLRIVEFDPTPPELPRVPGEYALELFQRLVRLSGGDTADLVLPMLRQTFHEERIKFFATSAIGFYINPAYGVFDPEDYQNHIPGDKVTTPDYIRGGIYPINVIEPVLWLGRNVARTAG